MAEHSFFIRAGWLIDGTGSPVLDDVVLHVEKGRFTFIERCGKGHLEPGGLVDLSDHTILPGFLDAHVHVFMSGTLNQAVRKNQLAASFEDVRDVISRHLKSHLENGVVGIRDGGDYAGHALRYRDECLSQERLPILLRVAGRAWRAPDRYGKLIGRSPDVGKSLAVSIDEEKETIDHIKIVNSGLNSLVELGKETAPQFSAEQLKAAVDVSYKKGLQVMVHANGKGPVRMAIEAGCHSIEHGFFMGKDNLKQMAEKQVLWVPTACTMKAYHAVLDAGLPEKDVALQTLAHQIEQIALADRYGVPMAIGTDSGSMGVAHGVSFKEELRILCESGIPIEKVVQCATKNSARALGMEQTMGTIEPHKQATLIAFKGEPDNIENFMKQPDRVYIKGEEWTFN